MNDIKILLCSTFRDFKGTENDEIQKMFLTSIENQSYKNYELVITLFGERNVQKELEKYNLKSTFVNGSVKDDYRYSLTHVVLNALCYAEEQEQDFIVLWTTCDVIYDSDFFEVIVNNYRQNTIGTSHPHTTFSSISDYKQKNNNKKGKLSRGFDVIYFDKYFLENTKVRNSIEKYVYNDWGIFEHFLISLNELNIGCQMYNIYEESKIYKIENNRELTNEPNQFLINSHKLNSAIFTDFLTTSNITTKYFDLVFCHIKFKLTKNIICHYATFSLDTFQLGRRTIVSIILKIIPIKIKKLIRRIIK